MRPPRLERTLDVVVGGVLLLVTLPLMGVCVALVAAGSGRPVLFRQPRIGRDGRPFEILKFRSMVRGADKMQWPLGSPEQSPEMRMRRHDPRITGIGRLLRRWGLDELPQLLNVLRGEMSLVGPRPLPPDDPAVVDQYHGRAEVLGLRPGLTGPFQVAVRRGSGIAEARKREWHYARHHTLSHYVSLLLLTPYALLRGGGDLLHHPPAAPEPGTLGPTPLEAAYGPADGSPSAIRALLQGVVCLTVRGRTILFDPVAVRAFGIDDAAYGLWCRLMQAGQASPAVTVSAGREAEASQELHALGQWLHRARGAVVQERAAPERYGECQISLEVTRRCTLRCRYCYSAEAVPPTRPPDMPWEVAEAAIRLLARRAKAFDCPGYLKLTGGEALLRFDFLQRLVSQVEAVAKRERATLRCSFGSTNGTVLPEGLASYLRDAGYSISVSIDGPEAEHDLARCHDDGRGSHAQVEHFACAMLAAGAAKSAAVTLAATNPRPRELLRYLVGLGFQRVVMKPARLPADHPMALAGDALEGLLQGYDRLAEAIVEEAEAVELRHLLAVLNPLDFWGRFLLRTLHGGPGYYRCAAARPALGIGTSGDLYPCASFIGNPRFLLGHVTGGVDEARRRDYIIPSVDGKAGCSQCWARHICGGGCAHSSYVATGDPHSADPAECQLTRHLAKLSMWLWVELGERVPDLRTRIQKHEEEVLRPAYASARPRA